MVLASAVFFLVQFVVGDMEWFLGGERGVWECRFLSGLPSYSVASGAGAHRAPVTDVSMFIQLMFLQSCENVEVPQIPFLTECSRFQLYYRGVYVQCKLCKSRRFTAQFLVRLFTCPLFFNDRCLGLDSAEKLWRFCSCNRCSSWRLLKRPLFL